ncbi:petal death [Chlorella sorokiniana]|uniref:Petal death n=1 Tax=Chlorella sorokiniana TaxID=3076 RepID=A0A2P6TKF4_CHLSO|nr:petal death [Chlorella sorokiniana]|eukprot:PRW44559.1 petal death [Chlorella sorokiniana]
MPNESSRTQLAAARDAARDGDAARVVAALAPEAAADRALGYALSRACDSGLEQHDSVQAVVRCLAAEAPLQPVQKILDTLNQQLAWWRRMAASVAASNKQYDQRKQQLLVALVPLLETRLGLDLSSWYAEPSLCPNPWLAPALPAALERSEQLAARLVRQLPPADRQRLRTAALSLGRVVREACAPLPAPIAGRLLALSRLGASVRPVGGRTPRRLAGVLARAAKTEDLDRTNSLRELMAKPGILLGPCCHDGLSARLIERAGFDFAFMSGFCTAAARLGAPDTGLMSYAEMVETGRNCHEATRRLPIIGDGDTGYGNAVNVKRTVRGYAAAGFAGVLIEDQQWPKSCGHVRNKRVVGRDEALARIRAACDARDEGHGILIVARTDSRQAESLQEALWRAAAFADAGADVVFIDALESAAEMEALCKVQGAYKMASMLEGGGKTPILTPSQLEGMGFKLCAYPLSLLGVSVRAMEDALAGLKRGAVPQPPAMPTFQELQAAVGFPEYYAEEARYAVPAVVPSSSGSSGGSGGSTSSPSSTGSLASSGAAQAASEAAGVEPDAVLEPGASREPASDASTGTIDLYSGSGNGDSGRYGARDPADRRAQWLRVKVTDTKSKTTTLDTRFPAGFLNSVATFIPAVAGVDLEGLVKQATGDEAWEPGKPIYRFDSGNDRIEIWLEFN